MTFLHIETPKPITTPPPSRGWFMAWYAVEQTSYAGGLFLVAGFARFIYVFGLIVGFGLILGPFHVFHWL
jgi:hypothetical protein